MADSTTSGLSSTLPGNILTTAEYAAQQSAAQQTSQQSTSMGQGAFLTLFTTQLKNQDPTDPVKNEAFVSQLAQFSQLEALQSMQTSMDNLVGSMSNDRLLGAASLMGKSVSVPNGPVVVSDTGISQGTVNLPSGADDLQLQVMDSSGHVVRTVDMGSEPPGDVALSWNGQDDGGNAMPNGNYRYVVTATSGGTTSSPTVSTFATVTGVTSAGTSDGTYLLQVVGGQTISLANVKQVSN